MDLKKFTSNPKIKLYLLICILLVSIITVLSFLPQKATKKISTSPIIPIVTPTDYSKPIVTPTDVFTEQTLIFSWEDQSFNFPSSIKKYAITEPLISQISANSLSVNLGFKKEDKQRSLKNTTYIWSNQDASLFISLDQNQITYQRKTDIPPTTNIINKEEAVSISKDILINYFGNNFIQTLSSEPTVRYLKTQLSSYNPISASGPDDARVIEISYKQSIDSLPVSSLSGETSVLSVVIDTQRNIYRLSITGGFISLSEQKASPIISFSELKDISPLKAQKVTAIKNVSYESSFNTAPVINIKVSQISLGYFLKNDNTLFPVFFLEGQATGNNLPKIDVVYMVPAIKD